MQKSKILALLLAVVMVVSMMAVPVFADTNCSICDAENPSWYALPERAYIGGSTDPVKGDHVYLAADQYAQYRQALSGKNFCIDLRGNTWYGAEVTNSNEAEVFRLSGGYTTNIVSTGARGTIVAQGTYKQVEGGVLYVGSKQTTAYVENVAISGGRFNATTDTYGGNVFVHEAGIATFVDCVFEDGDPNAKGTNIYNKGQLTLADCEVKDGSVYIASTGTLNLDGALTVNDIEIVGTLDLKGNTLTVNGTLDATLGQITDSVGGGKIVGEDLLFNEENEMIAVPTADGVVFETAAIQQNFLGEGFVAGAEEVKYYFYIDKAAADTAINEALAAGDLVLDVLVEWAVGDDEMSKTFTLEGDVLDAYTADEVWDANMLVLTLTGLEGVTKLQCTARIGYPTDSQG